MFDEADAHDNVELLPITEVANVSDLIVNRHFFAVPHALVPSRRVDAEEWICLREKSEPVGFAEFIVIDQHHLSARIHRRQLHRLVTLGCSEKQDPWMSYVESPEESSLAPRIPHRILDTVDTIPDGETEQLMHRLARAVHIHVRKVVQHLGPNTRLF